MKTFCGLKCTVKPHKSLNTSKGIVRCPALSKQSCEHILEFMGEQGVTDVRRINVHPDGALKPTNTFVFTFDSPFLPANVKIGFIQAKVDVYIPNPLRCYKRQVFGHENKCGRQVICVNCSMPEHCASGQCQRPAKCANCSGDHSANSKDCPQWEKERKILKIKCENTLSFPEARKQFEQFYQARTYASAVKPGTCNKSTETDKTAQTDDSFTEYLKQQTQEPPKGKPQEKSTSSSLPGPALKPATLGMIRKEGEKKKKRRETQKTRKRRKTKTISQRKRTKRKRRRKSNTSSEKSIFCV